MGRTIVQEYGPIYGEPVNGTVQGRPNGSVFVPVSNTVVLSLEEDYRYFEHTRNDVWRLCNSSGQSVTDATADAVAQAQDLASYIAYQFFSDEELSTLVAYWNCSAGQFNQARRGFTPVENAVLGDSLYLRVQLMNNGVAIATSDVIEVEVYP